MVSQFHDHTLKLSKDRWVIVGDETGTLDEFESNNTNLKSTMCWLAIPPGVSLESLPPNFHCSGNGGNPQYKKGIEHLSKHDGILMFTFAYEQGEKVENTTKIGESTHLNFWQDTLPLVLEKVSTECKSSVGVDIFVEQVFQLESGLEIIEPIINSSPTCPLVKLILLIILKLLSFTENYPKLFLVSEIFHIVKR